MADELVHAVLASAAVHAGIARALVHVAQASGVVIAARAFASIAVYHVDTAAAVRARIAGAFVNIGFTMLAGEAGLARARIPERRNIVSTENGRVRLAGRESGSNGFCQIVCPHWCAAFSYVTLVAPRSTPTCHIVNSSTKSRAVV